MSGLNGAIQTNRTRLVRLVVGLGVAAWCWAAAGCGSHEAEEADRIHFNPLERDAQTTREIEPPEPSFSIEENPEYQQVIDAFRENAVNLFQRDRDDMGRRIAQIEDIFMQTGKYLEFVSILQDVVDEVGLSNPAAIRLAWGYVRLGPDETARSFLERLLEEHPEDPRAHFVYGSYWFEKARDSEEAMARAVLAWKRSLEFDEEAGRGRDRRRTRSLEERVRMMEKQLPRPAKEIVAEADERK